MYDGAMLGLAMTPRYKITLWLNDDPPQKWIGNIELSNGWLTRVTEQDGRLKKTHFPARRVQRVEVETAGQLESAASMIASRDQNPMV